MAWQKTLKKGIAAGKEKERALQKLSIAQAMLADGMNVELWC